MLINNLSTSINISKINKPKISFTAIKNQCLCSSKGVGDVFQRTTNPITNVSSVNTTWNEDKIQEIYDRVFEDVLKDFPFAKEYGFKKPALVLDSKSEYAASYSFASNKINFNQEYLGNICHIFKPGNGKEISIGFLPISAFLLEYEDLKNTFGDDIEAGKLNNQEKELFISSAIAHELRHWIQDNTLASTNGCSDKFLSVFKPTIEIVKMAEKQLENCKLLGVNNSATQELEKKYRKLKAKTSYVKDFKPAVMLDENHLLKLSTKPNDNRYWSVKDHLLADVLRYNNKKKDIYYSSIKEADAYNYQLEYVINHLNDKRYCGKSDRFTIALLTEAISRSNSCFDGIKNSGITPIEITS